MEIMIATGHCVSEKVNSNDHKKSMILDTMRRIIKFVPLVNEKAIKFDALLLLNKVTIDYIA